MVLPVDFVVALLSIGGIYAIAALSLNFITGYTGLVSIGHAAFLAIGAYSQAMLVVKYGTDPKLAFLISILFGGLLGAFLGLPSLRVSDDFLAIATIGVNFIVVGVLQYSSFFGGTIGIGPIPQPSVMGVSISGDMFLLVTLVFVGITIGASWWIKQSWLGIAFLALREDEIAAENVGIHVDKFKIISFTISGMFAGLAGALYAHYFGFITPSNFGFLLSVDILVFAVFGGLGTVTGPVLGAYVLYTLPQFLRFFEQYRLILYGLILVIVIMFEPRGLMGLYDRLRRELDMSSLRGSITSGMGTTDDE